MLLKLFVVAVLIGPSFEQCLDGQVQTDCGSPCPKTCADPSPICATVCIKGCECPDGGIWHDNECIDLSMCPNKTETHCPRPSEISICVDPCNEDSSCTGGKVCCQAACGKTCVEKKEQCMGGQVQNSCASACPKTCDEPSPACVKICADRCECPDGGIWHDNKCIDLSMCPNKTEKQCPRPSEISTCADPCNEDSSCTGGKVCCREACVKRYCTFEFIQSLLYMYIREVYKTETLSCTLLQVCCPAACGKTCVDKKEQCMGGQVQNSCASACPKTCDEPSPACVKICADRCECPDGGIWHNNECIDLSMCPNKTENICKVGRQLPDRTCSRQEGSCPENYYCEVEKGDAFAVCCPITKGEGCRPRLLSEDAKDTLEAVKDGESDPVSLIEYLPEIARAGCLERLYDEFTDDTCDKEVFLTAVCRQHDRAVIKGFLKCLPQADRCTALTQIFSTEEARCIKDADLAVVAEMFVTSDCELPVKGFFLLSQGLMLKYIKGLQTLEPFMVEFLNYPKMFQLLSCNKKKKLIEEILKGGYTINLLTEPRVIQYIPYLPETSCKALVTLAGSQLADNLDDILEINFECAETDNIYSQIESFLRENDGNLPLISSSSSEEDLELPDSFLDDLDPGSVAACPELTTCVQNFYQEFACQGLENLIKEFQQCVGVIRNPACVAALQAIVLPIQTWTQDIINLCSPGFNSRLMHVLYRQNKGDSHCKFQCGRHIAQKVVELKEANNIRVDFTNFEEQLGNLAECLDTDELIGKVQPGECESIDTDIITELEEREGRRLLAQCLVRTEDHVYTDENLQNLGCLLFKESPGLLRRLSKAQLCRVISNNLLGCLDDIDFLRSINPSVREYVAKTCNDTAAIVNKIRQLRLEEKKDDSAEDNLDDAEAEMKHGNKAKARVLILLAIDKLNVTEVLKMKMEVVSIIPAGKLKQLVMSGGVDITQIDIPGTTKRQKKVLLKTYLQSINATLKDLEEDMLESLKEMLANLNYIDLAEVCDSQPVTCISVIFQQLEDQDISFSGKVVEKLNEWRQAWMEAQSSISETQIESLVAEALRHISLEELEALDELIQKAITRKLAEDESRSCGSLTDQERMDQVRFALADFPSVTEDDVEIASLLADGVPEEVSFTDSFLFGGGLTGMGVCPFCLKPKTADKLISTLRDFEDVDYESLGCWLPTLLTDDLSAENRETVLDAIWDHRESILDALDCSEDRQVKCRLSSLDGAGLERMAELKKQVRTGLREAAEKAQADREEDEEEIVRRKRAPGGDGMRRKRAPGGDGMRRKRAAPGGDGMRRKRAAPGGDGMRRKRAAPGGDGMRRKRAAPGGDGMRRKRAAPGGDGMRRRLGEAGPRGGHNKKHPAEKVVRRRREAVMYLCDTLEALDSLSLVEVLTVENAQAMDEDEFLDCLSTLGDASGWPEAQSRAMFEKALMLLDTTACDLTDASLSEMGSLAYGLTTAEISCLEIDLDMLTTLGQLHMWSDQQLMALASRYLEVNSVNSAADFTSDILVALGHILCGLEDAQIRTIPPAEYWSASTVIGELETASVSCLRALLSVATHADAHGPLADWTGVTYSDAGILLGALTGEQLQNADADDYTGFQENGLQHIPVEELNKLDTSDLTQLSRGQLLQLTAEQREGLSDELDDEVQCLVDECAEDEDSNEEEGDDDGPITGVAGLAVSLVTLICGYMFTLILM